LSWRPLLVAIVGSGIAGLTPGHHPEGGLRAHRRPAVRAIEEVISRPELAAFQERYKQIAGYDRARLKAAADGH
jgi:hypothetical protein